MTKLDVSFSHYIDFPLHNLFEDYQVKERIGLRTASDALAREKEQYAAAKFIVCMSPWAARQVIERCSVPSEKVHAILPGANLPDSLFMDQAEHLEIMPPPDGRSIPLRIAFVGKSPRRKGLDRLVGGVRILGSRGLRAIIHVIGPRDDCYPNDPVIEHLGFINKQLEPERFVSELRRCHVGALPSYQEAFGIAALEYLRCGLPALITRVGGLGESVPLSCSILLEQNCTAFDIADALEYYLRNPERFLDLRARAQASSGDASWSRCVHEFQLLWMGAADTSRTRQDTP